MAQLISVLICAFTFALSSAAFAADMVIVASTAPAFSAGQIIQHDTPLDIPAGSSITVIAQNGQSRTLTGPYSGAPGIGSGSGGKDGVVASLSGLFAGSGQESATLGVMRSIPPLPPSDPWVVNIGRSGDHCVPAKGSVQFWRAQADRTQILVLKHMGKPRAKSQADWTQDAQILTWPEDVPRIDGGTYLARIKDGKTARKVTLHIAPDGLKSDVHSAAWMADQGCRRQAIILLSTIR